MLSSCYHLSLFPSDSGIPRYAKDGHPAIHDGNTLRSAMGVSPMPGRPSERGALLLQSFGTLRGLKVMWMFLVWNQTGFHCYVNVMFFFQLFFSTRLEEQERLVSTILWETHGQCHWMLIIHLHQARIVYI